MLTLYILSNLVTPDLTYFYASISFNPVNERGPLFLRHYSFSRRSRWTPIVILFTYTNSSYLPVNSFIVSMYEFLSCVCAKFLPFYPYRPSCLIQPRAMTEKMSGRLHTRCHRLAYFCLAHHSFRWLRSSCPALSVSLISSIPYSFFSPLGELTRGTACFELAGVT